MTMLMLDHDQLVARYLKLRPMSIDEQIALTAHAIRTFNHVCCLGLETWRQSNSDAAFALWRAFNGMSPIKLQLCLDAVESNVATINAAAQLFPDVIMPPATLNAEAKQFCDFIRDQSSLLVDARPNPHAINDAIRLVTGVILRTVNDIKTLELIYHASEDMTIKINPEIGYHYRPSNDI